MSGAGGVGRRGLLRGAALAGAGLAAGGAAAPVGPPVGGPVDPLAAPVAAFHGARQASVVAAQRRATAFVSLDVTADGRSELLDALRVLTDRCRFLTSGGTPEPVGITAPPADSGCSVSGCRAGRSR